MEDPRVQFVRWFNRHVPWNQLKPSLAKRVMPCVDTAGGPRVYEHILDDMRMRLDLSTYFERWMYLHTYEPVTLDLFRRLLRPGDVYVDAGANIGLFVLAAAKEVGGAGRVYAFEPQPGVVQRLEENVRLNHLDHVQVIPKGCWHEAGGATLHAFDDQNILEPSMAVPEHKTLDTRMEIQTVRIDEVVPGPVRLMKVDIEGAEWSALRGAERLLFGESPPHLVIELNPKTCPVFGYHPIELVDWLMERSSGKGGGGGYGEGYRMHLIKSRRIVDVDRDGLRRLFESSPDKLQNVWFEPVGDG